MQLFGARVTNIHNFERWYFIIDRKIKNAESLSIYLTHRLNFKIVKILPFKILQSTFGTPIENYYYLFRYIIAKTESSCK
jgi:hypothetical protein